MEVNHFSHQEHPLILKQVPDKNDDEKAVICYGCQKEISEPEAYSCLPCDYFLHKRCAELPEKINHPMHSQHPLILLKQPNYKSSTCGCDACGREGWKFFTYNCSLCEFDLDVSCAILDRSFRNEGHEHPLTPLPRPATFFCNACCTTGEDSSYVCSICPFWIHEKCASLPKIMDFKDHNHSLLLADSIPFEHRSFKKFCAACGGYMHPQEWCYFCSPCRYFIHLTCLGSPDTKSCLGSPDTKSTEGINKSISDGEQNWIELPSAQAAQEMITLSLLGGNKNEIQIEEIISHFSHKHQLTLSNNLQNQNETMIGKEVICDCCIEPISNSDPHYSCVDCRYFIHATCFRLPNEIKILNHPEHPLFLEKPLGSCGAFFCQACGRESNGLLYDCKPCHLYVCIKCISVTLTKTVAHRAHDKPLTTNQPEDSNIMGCSGCRYDDSDPKGFELGCDNCHYYLCTECALLPPSTKHRWDDHPLILIYSPYFEHPDEFYCVSCEEEIDPIGWMYHCRECDNSFHVWCIPQIRLFRNLKFGRTFRADNHPHSLTHVPEAKYKSFCEGCSRRLDWEIAFECDACRFYLCPNCATAKDNVASRNFKSLDDSSQWDNESMPADLTERQQNVVSLLEDFEIGGH